MAIMWYPETDELKPGITRYRGFSGKVNDLGYKALSQYLHTHIDELKQDCE